MSECDDGTSSCEGFWKDLPCVPVWPKLYGPFGEPGKVLRKRTTPSLVPAELASGNVAHPSKLFCASQVLWSKVVGRMSEYESEEKLKATEPSDDLLNVHGVGSALSKCTLHGRVVVGATAVPSIVRDSVEATTGQLEVKACKGIVQDGQLGIDIVE